MKHAIPIPFRELLVALAALPLAAAAQEPPVPKPAGQDGPRPGLPPLPGGAEEDARQELLRLFAKVENRLRAIDTQLFEASRGRVPVGPIAGSGIEELLRAGQEANVPQSVGGLLESASRDSRRTQQEIQEILRIAGELNRQQQPGGGGGQGEPKPGDGSPLERSGREPSGREATPKLPGSKPDGPEPGEGEIPRGDRPDDPSRPARNQPGSEPPPSKTGPGSAADGADRWGDLPVRAREIFRVEGSSDLPPQYRDWIDGYYKKLQSLERR